MAARVYIQSYQSARFNGEMGWIVRIQQSSDSPPLFLANALGAVVQEEAEAAFFPDENKERAREEVMSRYRVDWVPEWVGEMEEAASVEVLEDEAAVV